MNVILVHYLVLQVCCIHLSGSDLMQHPCCLPFKNENKKGSMVPNQPGANSKHSTISTLYKKKFFKNSLI